METIKHFLLTLVALLCSISANAYDFMVSSICYNITSESELTAEVTSGGNYNGQIDIPSTVSYNGVKYKVTRIGNEAFYSCSYLNSVTIPSSVTSIGKAAFHYCTGLRSITIPEGVISLESRAFERCYNITTIKIPTSVTNIDSYAFEHCQNLTSFTIPNGVTNIVDGVFSNCYKLSDITIPYGLVSIGKSAFYKCSNLDSVAIPNSVTTIGSGAFYSSGLTSLVIPESVKSIGSGTFEECRGLTSVTMPNSITEISGMTFRYCTRLTSINMPEDITSIGYNAFQYCLNLTSIAIPRNVTKIENSAFSGCSGLTDIYCFASSVPETYSSAFGSNIGNATLHVPSESIEAYAAAEPWSGFGAIVALPAEEVELTIGTTGATTFCSEYALDFTDAEGVKAYAATGYNTETGVVTLTRVKTAKAGTGLFVVGDEGTYSIPTIESSADNSLNMLVGTTEEVTIPAADGTYTNYIYGKSDDTTGFFKLTGDKVIPAGKAYLQIPTAWFPAVAESKIKIEFEDGTTTGIDDVEEQTRPNDGVIYDLHGCVVKNPGKGIYIVNGKKVLF